jgi:hypothetical protein
VFPLLDVMKAWHDVFMLFGTASATLIGLLFVAASVSSGILDQSKHHALGSFWTPSVVHFSCVLVGCVVALCPLQSWLLFGILVFCVGGFGLCYSAVVLRRMILHGLMRTIDLEDRALYCALPAVGYVVMTAAGITLLSRTEWGCDVLAGAMCLLLLVGIRNAWDITAWSVMRRPNSGS